MRIWLITQGYRMCWRSGRIAGWWSDFWFRHYCPYPIQDDWSVRACIKAGKCSCNNLTYSDE